MSGSERRGSSRDFTFLALLVIATAAVQVWIAWRYFGFLTGDDVEVVAEAFRVAVGFRYRAWDIRCVFVPDTLVAPSVWLASHLGITSVRALVVAATLPSIVAHAASTVLVHAIAFRLNEDQRVARAAAILFALHWIPFGFASTTYPRAIATMCVVLAVYVLIRTDAPLAAVAAGALCAVAFADRFSEIVFLVPVAIIAKRRFIGVLGGFAATVFLVVGVHDYFSWGEWFGSVRKFAELTFARNDFASRLKHQSPFWYLLMLPRWISPFALPLIWFGRRQRLMMFVLVPLALLSFVQHKELRYLQGTIPFVALLIATGFGAMQRRAAATTLLAVTIVWQLYGVNFVRRKSMPAVIAAQMLGADPSVHEVAMSQLWAYGDRLYFGDRMSVVDVGTPPRALDAALRNADAVCVYETDLTDADRSALQNAGFAFVRKFSDAAARDVVVFSRSSSGTSDRARR